MFFQPLVVSGLPQLSMPTCTPYAWYVGTLLNRPSKITRICARYGVYMYIRNINVKPVKTVIYQRSLALRRAIDLSGTSQIATKTNTPSNYALLIWGFAYSCTWYSNNEDHPYILHYTPKAVHRDPCTALAHRELIPTCGISAMLSAINTVE